MSTSKGPTANTSTIDFATAATAAVLGIVRLLAKSPDGQASAASQRSHRGANKKTPSPLFSILASHLGEIKEGYSAVRDGEGSRRSLGKAEVVDFLTVLEGLVKGKFRPPSKDHTFLLAPFLSPSTSRPFNPAAYPELQRIIDNRPNKASLRIEKLVESGKYWRKLDETIKGYLPAQAQSEQRWNLSDLATSTPHPHQDWSEQAQKLHVTICRHCVCSSLKKSDASCFTANLALTSVDRPEPEKQSIGFNIFFSHPHLDDRVLQWNETWVSVLTDNNSTNSIRWIDVEAQMPLENFCSFVREEAMGRWLLTVADNHITYDQQPLPTNRLVLYRPSISLATVLDNGDLKDDIQLKAQLSYILSKSVWQFYDSLWMADTWTRDTVHFMAERVGKQDAVLVHKPMITAEMVPTAELPSQQADTKQQSQASNPVRKMIHIYPKILSLGIMLIEILTGESLVLTAECYGQDGRERLNSRHALAGNLIISDWWAGFQAGNAITLELKGLIEVCVKPDTGKLGTDPAHVRDRLYHHVVAPLHQLYRTSWPDVKEPEDFKFDPVVVTSTTYAKFVANADFEQNDCLTIASCGGRLPQYGRKGPERPSAALDGTASIGPQAVLFDARRPEGQDAVQIWREWAKLFTEFRGRILPETIGARFDAENGQRVRITVIDTGIDASHPYIRRAGWAADDAFATDRLFHDFAEGATDATQNDAVDKDGHGTFIAGLLLQLAPDVELSVARIGETRQSILEDCRIAEKIALAIGHAIDRWQSDIISMSFGCRDMSPRIRDAIERAVRKNIIVLAAAGNSGNNRGVAYPASEDGVFKIFAADLHGKQASFSPPTDDRNPDLCYHIHGCGVVSSWPCSQLKTAQEQGLLIYCDSQLGDHRHSPSCNIHAMMSGTSCSTPIVAALVALLYQFHDTYQVRLKLGSENRFKTPKAVRAILRQMSRTSSGENYNLLVPWVGREDRFQFPSTQDEEQRTFGTTLHQRPQAGVGFFKERLGDILDKAKV